MDDDNDDDYNNDDNAQIHQLMWKCVVIKFVVET